ncbi:hypothetical protein C5S32_03130 [ANME-1 cluster archaeon GoMg1]|nr:hypothetical protein [ANME-1 cluster archaeon GoMg1]
MEMEMEMEPELEEYICWLRLKKEIYRIANSSMLLRYEEDIIAHLRESAFLIERWN